MTAICAWIFPPGGQSFNFLPNFVKYNFTGGIFLPLWTNEYQPWQHEKGVGESKRAMKTWKFWEEKWAWFPVPPPRTSKKTWKVGAKSSLVFWPSTPKIGRKNWKLFCNSLMTPLKKNLKLSQAVHTNYYHQSTSLLSKYLFLFNSAYPSERWKIQKEVIIIKKPPLMLGVGIMFGIWKVSRYI